MKIAADNRIVSHFFKDEKSPVYTILYPPQHSLKERCEVIEDLLLEMKLARKKEKELEDEHAEYQKNGGKDDFQTWLKKKAEKIQKEAEEKAKLEQPKIEEVKDLPIEEAVVEKV